jgi:hypothetical protein
MLVVNGRTGGRAGLRLDPEAIVAWAHPPPYTALTRRGGLSHGPLPPLRRDSLPERSGGHAEIGNLLSDRDMATRINRMPCTGAASGTPNVSASCANDCNRSRPLGSRSA